MFRLCFRCSFQVNAAGFRVLCQALSGDLPELWCLCVWRGGGGGGGMLSAQMGRKELPKSRPPNMGMLGGGTMIGRFFLYCTTPRRHPGAYHPPPHLPSPERV